MLTREENDLLMRVEGDAPMGQMMRRYWMPALMSSEVAQPGGPPRRLRILGEDLVAFRDSSGRVGVMDEYCPHRRASLVLARNENDTLQCLYHGWRIDVRGNIIDTPCEPEDSDFKSKLKHIAYPTAELGGMVFVYMGPPGTEPALPAFPWTSVPDTHRVIIKMRTEANWAQCLEGVLDSSHSNFLHSSEIVPGQEESQLGGTSREVKDNKILIRRPSNDGRPRLEAQNTQYGFRYAAIRKPINDPDKYHYIRVTLFVAPFYGMFPAPDGLAYIQAFVPMDDRTTMFYWFQASFQEPMDAELAYARSGARMGPDLNPDYSKVRTRDNNWLQDRDAMKVNTFSGIYGVQTQDMAVQESMGFLCDRTNEHLGASDVAVIRMRRLMLDSARRFHQGGVPLGLDGDISYARLRAEEKIIPLEQVWQTVGAFAGEPREPVDARA